MLITGAAQRIGAYIAKKAHAKGYTIVLHYRQSFEQTQELALQLNTIRKNSCMYLQADFNKITDYRKLVLTIEDRFGRLDVLINNASSFFPTPANEFNEVDYNELFNSNVKGPLFLAHACYELLKKNKGSIINLVDIHADKPLRGYPLYSMAKASNKMMVLALAKEYAPEVRVNGVAPGCICWPQEEITSSMKSTIIKRIALSKAGKKKHVFQTIQFLIKNTYMTGQIIVVDGGRSLNM